MGVAPTLFFKIDIDELFQGLQPILSLFLQLCPLASLLPLWVEGAVAASFVHAQRQQFSLGVAVRGEIAMSFEHR